MQSNIRGRYTRWKQFQPVILYSASSYSYWIYHECVAEMIPHTLEPWGNQIADT